MTYIFVSFFYVGFTFFEVGLKISIEIHWLYVTIALLILFIHYDSLFEYIYSKTSVNPGKHS